MSKRIFTEKEIEYLLKNKHIKRCSERSVMFSKEFKTDAIRLYEQGLTPTEIFGQAELDLSVIGRDRPKGYLRDWRRVVRKKGLEGLSEVRGKNSQGRPKTKNLTVADKIKRLEAEVVYLKAENDFLAKLRAKRTE